MKITLKCLIVGMASAVLPAATFAAGGGGMDSGSMSMSAPRQQSPEEMARNAYNDGVRAVKQAKKYEEEVAEATREDKKAKAAERVRKQYEKARGYFANAAGKQPSMHEAWNYIGFTSRKLGNYEEALTAYAEALRLKPDYAEAIEYRGEAYVALNRMNDAKDAYMALYRDSREFANQLMQVMQKWVEDRKADPAGVASTDIEAFAQWVTERTTIAQQTASLAIDAATSTRWQ